MEGVGDVFEKNQTEDNVLVLSRVHVVAQRVRGGPELGLEVEVRAVPSRFGCIALIIRRIRAIASPLAVSRNARPYWYAIAGSKPTPSYAVLI